MVPVHQVSEIFPEKPISFAKATENQNYAAPKNEHCLRAPRTITIPACARAPRILYTKPRDDEFLSFFFCLCVRTTGKLRSEFALSEGLDSLEVCTFQNKIPNYQLPRKIVTRKKKDYFPRAVAPTRR